MATEATDHIALELTKAEALVLHDFLSRASMRRLRREGTGYEVGHKAEYIVLVNIEASLEKVLAEPFAADYGSIIQRARDEIAATWQ